MLAGRQPPVAAYGLVLALALAGYLGGTAWLVPVGALCLTVADWRPWRPGRAAGIEWTSKATTYLITGVIADLGLAGVAFLAGRAVRLLLG